MEMETELEETKKKCAVISSRLETRKKLKAMSEVQNAWWTYFLITELLTYQMNVYDVVIRWWICLQAFLPFMLLFES